MRFAYIFTGFGLLFASAYFDSLRGPLLPLLNHELQLPYEQVSLFLVVGYLASMAFGRLLMPWVESLGPKRVATALCLALPLTSLSAYAVAGLGSLILLGILVASLSSTVGSLANLFVIEGTDPQYRARFFGILHAMYGLGSWAGPLLLGVCLAQGWNWRWGIYFGAVAPLILAGWLAWGVPRTPPVAVVDTEPPPPFRWRSLQGLLVVSFAVYVVAEVGTSMWMVAYLVEVRHLNVAVATQYVTAFFVMMTATRVACFWLRSDRMEAILIVGCLWVALACLLLGLSGFLWAFPLSGLVGPYFPLVLARMSRYLPREAPTLTLRILIVVQGTLGVCHFGIGYVATHFGVSVAYCIPAVAYVFAILLKTYYMRLEAGSKSAVPA